MSANSRAKSDSYKDAGVDIDLAGKLLSEVKSKISAAARDQCASREGWSDAPRLGQGTVHPRITQRYRVGALEPKLHSPGVAD